MSVNEKNSEQPHQHFGGSAKWLEHPVWRQNILSRSCVLTRRKPEDAAFLRLLWSTPAFISSFHPLAPPLPESDEVLEKILQKEFLSTIDQSRSLHWVIRSPDFQPWGLLSLCQISIQHRRAEIMLGVLPGKPFGLPIAAMLMIYIFFFKSIGFNKLCSLVFLENEESFKTTRSLGFAEEGVLAKHLFNPKTGDYCDVHQFGILKQEAFSEKNTRLMHKLLS